VGVPVGVTEDVGAARDRAARLFAAYEAIPTYQRILRRGTTANPVDVAVLGSAAHVHDRLRRFADAGATDICASVLGLDDDRESSRLRTLDVLAAFGG
jgi:hypothetical protein